VTLLYISLTIRAKNAFRRVIFGVVTVPVLSTEAANRILGYKIYTPQYSVTSLTARSWRFFFIIGGAVLSTEVPGTVATLAYCTNPDDG
jgi:hypothetical protein